MTNGATNVLSFPAAAQMRTRRYPLRDGDAGVARTVHFMRGLAKGNEGAAHPHVRAAAITATRGLHPGDKGGQVNGVLCWVKENIEFRGEYKETLQSPLVTLQYGAGDCDDHSTLIAAMLKSLGFNTRFQTVASDGSDPDTFTHVYGEVECPPGSGEWMGLDSTVERSFPGWRPETVYRSQAWPSLWPSLGDGYDDGSSANPILSQILTQDVSPLSQALAYKITGTTPIVGDLNFGNLFSATPTGLSSVPWTWLVIGGFVVFAIMAARR
jgi:hypothetical protein